MKKLSYFLMLMDLQRGGALAYTLKGFKRSWSLTLALIFALQPIGLLAKANSPFTSGPAISEGPTTSPSVGTNKPLPQGLTPALQPQTSRGIDAIQQAITESTADTNQNIQKQARNASSGQTIGMIVGIAGTAFATARAVQTCSNSKQRWQCPLWIIGAAASAGVALTMSKASRQSDQTDAGVSVGPTPNSQMHDPNSQMHDPNSQMRDKVERELASAERSLSQLGSRTGIKADLRNGRVTLPNGKTVSVSELNNPKALAAAGMSPEQIRSLGEVLSQINAAGERAIASRGGIDRGTTDLMDNSLVEGGGRASASHGGATLITPIPGGAMLPQPTTSSGSAGGGLRKMFNGEPIGTADDNLFAQISRRYDVVARRGDVIVDPAGIATANALAPTRARVAQPLTP